MSKTPHRIIFAGTPAFAVPSLRALVADPAFDVKLVITQPDKPVGRTQKMTPPPVKVAAEEAGIPVWQPNNINGEWRMENGESNHSQFSILNSPFDFLVVVAYGQILSEEILHSPAIAPVNVHASLLPRWRGASPIQSAILHGDHESGVTIQRIVEKLDAGPILAMAKTEIEPRETAATLEKKLADMGAGLLTETLKNPITETPQDEAKITICKKLTRATGMVDAGVTAEEIDRRVRALVPWPGVRMVIAGEEVKLIAVSHTPAKDSVEVPCKNSVLHVLTVQPSGKTPMPAVAWMRGKR